MGLLSRKKIPLPSFAPPPPPLSDKKNTEAGTNDISQNDRLEMGLIRLPINEHSVIRLDSALQLHRHQQEQQGQLNSDRISFANFSKISSKVETAGGASLSQREDNDVVTAVSGRGENDRNPPIEDLPELWSLSKAERFWHDLYCVAVPALYRVNDSVAHSNGEENESNSNFSPTPKKRRKLAAIALELLPRLTAEAEAIEGSKNRLRELRRLIREARTHGVPKKKSDMAFHLLLKLRREKADRVCAKKYFVGNDVSADASSSNPNEFNIVQSLFQDADPSSATKSTAVNDGVESGKSCSVYTTIDDRIRARAKERERNMEQARAARKDPREERVAVADALYSYACHVLRRRRSRSRIKIAVGSKASNTTMKRLRSKASSSSPKLSGRSVDAKAPTTATSKCTVTFKEIVESGLPNRSRKDTARIMLDIVQLTSTSSNSSNDSSSSSSVAPRFLKWKDAKTGQANGVPISKNAAITIDTYDFKKVREILNQDRLSNATIKRGKKRSIPDDETKQDLRADTKEGETFG